MSIYPHFFMVQDDKPATRGSSERKMPTSYVCILKPVFSLFIVISTSMNSLFFEDTATILEKMPVFTSIFLLLTLNLYFLACLETSN